MSSGFTARSSHRRASLNRRQLHGVFYFDLVEFLRKVLLVGVGVLVAPGSFGQLAFGILIVATMLFVTGVLSPYKNVSDEVLAVACQASLLLTLAGAVILKGRLNAGPLEDDEQAAVAAALIFVAAAPVALGVALALRDLCADRCSLRRRQFAGATTPPTAPVPEASVRTTAHPGEISYTVHANAARV